MLPAPALLPVLLPILLPIADVPELPNWNGTCCGADVVVVDGVVKPKLYVAMVGDCDTSHTTRQR